MNKEQLNDATFVLGDIVSELEYDVTRSAHKIIEQADYLIRNLAEAQGRMRLLLDEAKKDEGVLQKRTGLNSLGVLQGNGVEFDRLCGEFTIKQEHLKNVRRAQLAIKEVR